MTPSALRDLRVLDVAGTVATAYCGKLFADHGADVVNLEPPGTGHPIRRLAPHKGAIGVESSGLAAYLSVNKRSVAADLTTPAGLNVFEGLAAAADLLIFDGEFRALDIDRVAEQFPQLTCLCVSWFGRSGPYSKFAGTDGVVHALTGLSRGMGTKEGPPLLPAGYQAQVIGGLTAYVAALGTLIGQRLQRRASGVIDVSILEANLCFTETGAVGAYHAPPVPYPRLGVNRYAPTFPMGIYPCKDGWIGVTALTPSQWQSFATLVGIEDLACNPKYFSTLARLEDAALIEAQMAPRLLERTAYEWFHEGQAARVPLALVPSMAELPKVDQYALREAFVAIEHPDLGTFVAPNTPFRLFTTPPVASGRAPRLGSSGGSTTWDVAPPQGAVERESVAGGALLRGVRVIDLSMGWAGPLAARHLADLGAEVIKVEGCQRFDWWRGWDVTPEMLAQNLHEKAHAFNMVNRNKLGITLDLAQSEGKALLKRLIALSDVVIENYSGEVLAKLGLDYASLAQVRPDLVMVSMPAFGTDGPWRGYRAYGSTVEQISGLPHLNGHADWPPTMQHVAYGDAVGGINGAAAALTALFHRKTTGQGQYADLSQAECLFPLAAHGIVSQSLLGAPPARRGSRREDACPSGVFPCAGEDAWVAVQVAGAVHPSVWSALCELIGAEAFANLRAAERALHEDELESRLAQWSRTRRPEHVMQALQSIGVAAGAVHSMSDLLHDPHFVARGIWQIRQRAHVGASPNPAAPYRFDTEPLPVQWPAPTLGQHNAPVLGDLLGLSTAELAGLESRAVVGQRPRMA